jgi:CBS domain-containing protein
MRRSDAMRRIPRIKTVMTPFPYSIAPSASLHDAKRMMDTHDVRHLPICDDQTVIGMLSDRELRIGLALSDKVALTVAEICLHEPLLVDLEERLDTVAALMAERRVGSVIVTRADKLSGVLTTTDVCRLLAELLRELGSEQDDDVA